MCFKCGRPTTSFKKMQLTNPPSILTIQIKRFEFRKTGKTKKQIIENQKKKDEEEGRKLKTDVNFAEKLMLSGETMDGQRLVARYSLRAVIVHKGNSISSGHYIALTKPENSQGASWWRYSDTSREPMRWEQVKQQQAYMLLYEKENSTTHELNDQNKGAEVTTETDHIKAASPSNDETTRWDLDILPRKEQLKLYRDETVFLKCMVKREAGRLSYQRLRDKARNQLKLRGGTEPEKATEKVKLPRQQQRNQAKKRDRESDDGGYELKECELTLRRRSQNSDEVPNPKRRHTSQHPEGMQLDIVN